MTEKNPKPFECPPPSLDPELAEIMARGLIESEKKLLRALNKAVYGDKNEQA